MVFSQGDEQWVLCHPGLGTGVAARGTRRSRFLVLFRKGLLMAAGGNMGTRRGSCPFLGKLVQKILVFQADALPCAPRVFRR